ncbi:MULTISPECIES: spermidine synthase [unclassified Uliginosibacterium]|uniref:spermine/spermidine synthase domain-containing protein n=1 Tax=unclassified Uliginosibacterium TaxID=2621521 RepID=UPI00130460C6|nr:MULTISPECIES: spermidine synthase [unclassified Uliginosibacterium]MDO6387178.1 transferase [Uliginosibacterium sp. 31-12]
MTLPPAGWLSLPANYLNESGQIWLREPADKNRQLLIRQLMDGIYPHPFVIDDGKVRRLHFSLKLVQSEMRLDAPDELAIAYTRAMLGFLLFQPLPKHVLIVGLGGGSLTKYCYRNLARSRVTTVELMEGVIACRNWFLIPPDDERLKIVQADAADYFAGEPDGADAILLDAYVEDGLAPQLCTLGFYEKVSAHLKPRGVLVTNISGHSLTAETHIELIREVFAERVVVVDVMADGNRIVYAFKDPAFPPDWQRLGRSARELEAKHPLEFAKLLRDMERSAQRAKRKGRR